MAESSTIVGTVQGMAGAAEVFTSHLWASREIVSLILCHTCPS